MQCTPTWGKRILRLSFAIEVDRAGMKSCIVSVIDGDGRAARGCNKCRQIFDAVDQAIEQWSRLWWFDAGAVAEVQVGNRRWRVRLRRVISWRGAKGMLIQ